MVPRNRLVKARLWIISLNKTRVGYQSESRSLEHPFWELPAPTLLEKLGTSIDGLSSAEAKRRLTLHDANTLHPRRATGPAALFLSQFKSPLILILLFASILSFALKDQTSALIIAIIVIASGILGFWQEYSAATAVEKLLAMVQINVTTLRDGKPTEIALQEIIPGDVVLLNAGNVVPGDGRLLESRDLFVNEASLTGETFPVEKTIGSFPLETPLSKRTNSVFMGSHVVSGAGKLLIARTGKATEFGKISETLKLRPPENEFERGIREFGYFLMEVTLLLVMTIFAVNVYFSRPVLDSFFFSLALAVGLTPQLLPAIVSVNLAYGAKHMASKKVIVKRLTSIETFGSMDILCSDKTGTLTEGQIQLCLAGDLNGQPSEKVFLHGFLNASLQAGYANPIDTAVIAYRHLDLSSYRKLDEEPYDFVRKRLSILVEGPKKEHFIVTKGAFSQVLTICKFAETPAGEIVDLSKVQSQIEQWFKESCEKGFRTLGIAYRKIENETQMTKASETEMIFLGFLQFTDPLRADIVPAIENLRNLGISLKIISGDSQLVVANAAKQAGLNHWQLMTGTNLRQMTNDALRQRVNEVDLYAEIEPNQKERIILALKQAGHVVGYMGDGINDASALHVADVGISVANAVDVAKEAADIVLVEKDLMVLERGVREGRTTFANTLKYVFMATSANFGNMFSMAGASLFLSFLPLLPTQILLGNLMTDFPEMTIATDSVDPEMVEKPRRWDIRFIRKFMVVFGLANSACDFLTFGVLLLFLHADIPQFRTGWFIENVVTAALIVLVIRTRRPFYKSKPGPYLVYATSAIVVVTLLLPYYRPLASLFRFKPLPPIFLLTLGLILLFYVIVAEVAKFFFYRKENQAKTG